MIISALTMGCVINSAYSTSLAGFFVDSIDTVLYVVCQFMIIFPFEAHDMLPIWLEIRCNKKPTGHVSQFFFMFIPYGFYYIHYVISIFLLPYI